MEFKDQGVPFDLLTEQTLALDEDLSERPVGGLGIHLARQVMDQVTYRR